MRPWSQRTGRKSRHTPVDVGAGSETGFGRVRDVSEIGRVAFASRTGDSIRRCVDLRSTLEFNHSHGRCARRWQQVQKVSGALDFRRSSKMLNIIKITKHDDPRGRPIRRPARD